MAVADSRKTTYLAFKTRTAYHQFKTFLKRWEELRATVEYYRDYSYRGPSVEHPHCVSFTSPEQLHLGLIGKARDDFGAIVPLQ